ncbi:maleylpyruvate isomerase family mycothiol-dependent enzyme [Kutzneria viridogrisea]|uniref:Mycothiol-dependent maleylpyruvate isomerase metal-binding domain-containing protein n=2 Tax=Kutzneria TaxID=43356 RepID=W5WHJ8_9PSEU|nr:maleylpyruvate isomerase N-terminal domain-containing protein [Kutzneria albida]AHI00082.1 hypothetical protein KALB_6723 [Kutzneria albida DSM 43870]MBA8925261.1 uncharacterized protein (TIGR03083 family) [Kutzneria viridogrisea]
MTGRALVDHDLLLEVLRAEVGLLARSAEGARPELPVPGCPGLTLGETVRHVGGVHRMALAWLRGGTRPVHWQRQPPVGRALTEFVLTGLAELLAELAAHPAEEVCSTWWTVDQTYGFWRRRMAHEATVHRVDVQGAAGLEIDPIDEQIALDGIDEVLTLWFAHRLTVLGVSGTASCKVAVQAAGHTWLVSAGPKGTAAWRTSEADAAQAQAVITGSARDVYLWLWGRVSNRHVRVQRDHDAVAQVWALLRLATR